VKRRTNLTRAAGPTCEGYQKQYYLMRDKEPDILLSLSFC